MAKAKRLSGGCQCGAVRYSIPTPTEGVHLCHCRMCQKAVGNVFAALAPVPLKTVRWTRGKPKYFRSSTDVDRGYCPKCGTPLTFRYRDGQRINFTIGSLDDPEAVTPTIHYGTESRVTWLRLSDRWPHEPTDVKALKKRFPKFKSFQHPDRDTKRWP
ncbi:MAG: GFA family protein [Rhodospirillaceae bacterium]|nr:GFA family protein [Rhodospirillaceae bacterium]